MQAIPRRRLLALLLLPMLALLESCSSSFGVVVATPAISPAGGSFTAPVTVAMTDSTQGASIFYTLDGSTPTQASTAYKSGFVLSQSSTVKAIATAPNDVTSGIATAAFVITIPQAAVPSFAPLAGTYTSTQSVTISDATAGAVIYYTTNGSAPTTSSSVYAGPIVVSATETIEAIAVAPGYGNSALGTAAYVINAPQAGTPIFSPPAGTYTTSQSITISDATAGAVIYYTTDGTTPTTASTVYSAPIYISGSQTFEALAVAPGYSNSLVATAVYTIVASSCTNPGPGTICTVAGNGIFGFSGDGGAATSAELNRVYESATDDSGNLYIADSFNNRIRRVTPAGIISTVAGNGTAGYSGDGGVALSAELLQPLAVTVYNGNLYIADAGNNRIRMVTPAGIISTIAGNGVSAYSGDGGLAISAGFSEIGGLVFDESGNLYVADVAVSRIRKIAQSGMISTVAGNGTAGFSGDGGPATSAELSAPEDVAVDSSGNLYIADAQNDNIRKVTPAGIISTIAGNGVSGYSGDGGLAISAEFRVPQGIGLDQVGNLFIVDTGNYRIRMLTPVGIISTVAGNGTAGFSGDGGVATSAEMNGSRGVAVNKNGDIYIADTFNDRIRKVFSTTTAPPTFAPPAGTYTSTQAVTIQDITPGASIYYTTDGSTPTTASTLFTSAITVSSAETLKAIAVAGGYANSPVVTAAYVIQLPAGACSTLPSGSICTVAGNGVNGYMGDGGAATAAKLATPLATAVDSNGNLYIADSSNHVVRMVTPAGVISTIAGNGKTAYTGDGGPATSAALSDPEGLTLDSSGNLYIADTINNVVRMVTPAGIISTVAGNGVLGDSGDGRAATSAELNVPWGVAVDSSGNLYIADTNNHRIRMVAPTGIISTVAGNGTLGHTGDGGAAVSAELYSPHGVSVDVSGNLYIADTSNDCIRKVTPAGIISTIAGNGTAGYSGDNGPAVSAELDLPARVKAALSGDLYIADTYNNRIRKVTPAGVISTVAGNGTPGYSGDNGPAVSAELFGTWDVAVDSSGNLFIADTDNNRIRKVVH